MGMERIMGRRGMSGSGRDDGKERDDGLKVGGRRVVYHV